MGLPNLVSKGYLVFPCLRRDILNCLFRDAVRLCLAGGGIVQICLLACFSFYFGCTAAAVVTQVLYFFEQCLDGYLCVGPEAYFRIA